MKVKSFLINLDSTILEKINEYSLKLQTNRVFKSYSDFEDIIHGKNIESIHFHVKPIMKELPKDFFLGSKI